ncbi:MAG: hypothetical protein JNM51_16575 [Bacteroidia bacterium]|nr:hypothetical protein [Bacteroidia bacterium]
MKLKSFTFGIAIVAIIGSGIFSSCKKKEVEEKDTDTSEAVDQSLAAGIVNDMTSISDEAAKGNVSSFKAVESNAILSTCAALTFDTLLAAKTITVNFGATNCLCNDGRNRRGALVLNFTGKYKDSLTVITITPQNYFVNDNQVLGSKTITNKGHNAAHHLVYEINANIQIVKADGSGTITWQSNRQREWLTGENTATWIDDTYAITGNANGTKVNGNTYSVNITSPLIRNMAVSCRRYFTQGTVELKPSGKATRYIDYGNGACDNEAAVTINGNTYIITLP